MRVTSKQKAQVTERARNLCEYCQSPGRFATQPLSVEHIHPRQQGGGSDEANLALACQGCNGHKHTKTSGIDPFTRQTVPLFHPRRQRWRDHFAWNEDFTHIIGLTATGRATVYVLQLNRESVVNLRAALCALDQHPPADPNA